MAIPDTHFLVCMLCGLTEHECEGRKCLVDSDTEEDAPTEPVELIDALTGEVEPRLMVASAPRVSPGRRELTDPWG